jgi:hypothetical protein
VKQTVPLLLGGHASGNDDNPTAQPKFNARTETSDDRACHGLHQPVMDFFARLVRKRFPRLIETDKVFSFAVLI